MSRGKFATAASAAALPFGAPARRDASSQRRAGQHLLLSASVVALATAMCAIPSGPAHAVRAVCGDPAEAPEFVPVGTASGANSVACGNGAVAGGGEAVGQ